MWLSQHLQLLSGKVWLKNLPIIPERKQYYHFLFKGRRPQQTDFHQRKTPTTFNLCFPNVSNPNLLGLLFTTWTYFSRQKEKAVNLILLNNFNQQGSVDAEELPIMDTSVAFLKMQKKYIEEYEKSVKIKVIT